MRLLSLDQGDTVIGPVAVIVLALGRIALGGPTLVGAVGWVPPLRYVRAVSEV